MNRNAFKKAIFFKFRHFQVEIKQNCGFANDKNENRSQKITNNL